MANDEFENPFPSPEDEDKKDEAGKDAPADEGLEGEHLTDEDFAGWDDDLFAIDDDDDDWGELGIETPAEPAKPTELTDLPAKSVAPSANIEPVVPEDEAAAVDEFGGLMDDDNVYGRTAQTEPVAPQDEDAYTFDEQAATVKNEFHTVDEDDVPLSISEVIRSRAEDIFGESLVDQVTAWPLWMVGVGAVIIITLFMKLMSLFATPTTAPRRVAGVQTQFTNAVSPQPRTTPTQPAKAPVSGLPTLPRPPVGTAPVKPTVAPTVAQKPVTPKPVTPPALTAPKPAAPVVPQVTPPALQPAVPQVRSLLPPPTVKPAPTAPVAPPAAPTSGAVLPAASQQMLGELNQRYKALANHARAVNQQYQRLQRTDATISTRINKLEQSVQALNHSINRLAQARTAAKLLAGAVTPAGRAAPSQAPQLNPVLPPARHRMQPRRQAKHRKHRAHRRHRASVFQTPSYYVRSAIPGRAWLINQNGTIITVRRGDRVRGYGIVTTIDSEQGWVATSSGVIFRYGFAAH